METNALLPPLSATGPTKQLSQKSMRGYLSS